MLSTVSRAVKCQKLSPVFLKNCPSNRIINGLSGSRGTIRGYSIIFSTNNNSITGISVDSNKFYHRSVITENSFQVTPTNAVES